MKKITAILIILISLTSCAQGKNINYDEVVLKFQSNYNEGNYGAVFNMFNKNLKQSLPEQKAISFFKNLKLNRGEIEHMEFCKIEKNSNVYKTTFEKAIRSVELSVDKNNNINRIYITQYNPDYGPELNRNQTKIILPFNEEWTVFWGGTNVEQNYHVAYKNQKYAYDLVITKDGKSNNGSREKNKNFYAFGKQIKAPCDAKVVKVITGVHDNIPGEMNSKDVSGNTVVLEAINGEFILFAHFKAKSIVVEEGQQIKQGDLLGLCGNSGNSSEPHLHLSLQNVKSSKIATGGKLYFDKIMVNGKIKEDYLPVKGQKIKNIRE